MNLGGVIQNFQCCQNIILFQILEHFFKCPRITQSPIVRELLNTITGFITKF